MFWRTRSGVEVDFVVYGPRGFWAFQVQNSANVRPADIRPLRAFREDYMPHPKHVPVQRYIEARVCGVADVDVTALVAHHRSHGRLATMTAVTADATLEHPRRSPALDGSV